MLKDATPEQIAQAITIAAGLLARRATRACVTASETSPPVKSAFRVDS